MKGKSLNNEPQETTETERVIEAIAMLSNLDRMFLKEIKMESVKGLKMGRELERSYFSFEDVFAKQSQEARSKIPLFTMEAFAKSEAKRIKAILDKVESLSNPDYFANHNAYIAATGYISYLNSITEPKQNKIVETPDTLKKSPGRPPKQKKEFTDFLSCSEEDKKKVIDVIKKQFKANGQPGIIKTCIALNHKDYFKWPTPRNEFWGALSSLLGEKFTDSNLNAHRKKMIGSAEYNPLKDEIEEIKGKLP